jgi:hypothetical protein
MCQGYECSPGPTGASLSVGCAVKLQIKKRHVSGPEDFKGLIILHISNRGRDLRILIWVNCTIK